MLEIGNRRYIGSKRLLLNDIHRIVEEYVGKNDYTFADLFAGTGLVSNLFIGKGKNVIMNDILYSNFIAYQTWFGKGRISKPKLKNIIGKFNTLKSQSLKSNYFSRIYGGKYFSIDDAKKIGFIRGKIEDMDLTKRERYVLITCLMYAADKIANTVGHFEHFLSKKPTSQGVVLKFPNILQKASIVDIHIEDANSLVNKIKADVVYLDPPYNARQYVNFYHVLENLARWEKPKEFEGTSMKFKRNHLKSDYSKSKAPQVMRDLVGNIVADIIVVSYNNTYGAKSCASNNKITEEEMMEILQSKGEILAKKSIDHKCFNSGKTNFNEHKEYLYVCKVRS